MPAATPRRPTSLLAVGDSNVRIYLTRLGVVAPVATLLGYESLGYLAFRSLGDRDGV